MKVHFIGIGGISMSGLANICLNLDYIVSGSDSQENFFTKELANKGATIHIGQSAQNIKPDIDLVIYTAAIHPDNPEWMEAKKQNLKMLSRSEFLGLVMKKYENSIAISGTHGKTTTTSMLSVLYSYSDYDPTILVGGNLKEINGNFRIGNSEHFITEACEYFDSFLDLYPKFGIILNIEADHLDYFDSLDVIIQSFRKFSQNVSSNGYTIANGDDQNVRTALKDLPNCILFGYDKNNDAVIVDDSFDKNGNGHFSIQLDSDILGPFSIKVPGKHNIMNATAAILTAYKDDIPLEKIQHGIFSYHGVDRRFQYKGNYGDVLVYDDYAHHPSEIKATLSAAKFLNPNRLIAIFQPHTYTRTKSLLEEFATSFYDADIVIITDIYASRETDTGLVSSQDLVNRLKAHGKDAIHLNDITELQNYLDPILQKNDIIFTIGAGDVYKLGEQLLLKNMK